MTQIEHQEDQSQNVVIRLLTNLIRLAVLNNASDVHIEPDQDKVRVRFRIDGVLREVESHPMSVLDPLASRIKVLADLNLAERRRPQDGRFQISADNKQLDIRVSIFPTVFGENMSLRILNKTNILLGLPSLGFAPDMLQRYTEMIHQPYGILFVTGPNGSGKTTTLYSTLNTINTPDKDIVTLEDPVEYQLPLVRQTQVDPDVGLTFAAGLRSLLRQDPDVILLGEVRDSDTASIAVRSALTGHLVLTTLHTNDSVGAVMRLEDMGIERVLIASATIGVLAQRLVRTLCTVCAEAYEASPVLKQELGLPQEEAVTLKKAVGCETWGWRDVEVRRFPLGRPRTPEGTMTGAGLRAAREAAQMGVRELARALGVSDGTVRRYEANERAIPDDVATAVRALVPSAPETPSKYISYLGVSGAVSVNCDAKGVSGAPSLQGVSGAVSVNCDATPPDDDGSGGGGTPPRRARRIDLASILARTHDTGGGPTLRAANDDGYPSLSRRSQ